MITETFFQGTDCSDLVLPDIKTFVDKGMGCDSSGDKFGDTLVLKIPIAYRLKDHKTKKDYVVFTATSKYTIITDGHLTLDELYVVFKEAMEKMLDELNKLELLNHLPATTELKPLPVSTIQNHLKFWTDQFS